MKKSETIVAAMQKAVPSASIEASPATPALQTRDQPSGSNAKPVSKRPNWPLILTIYAAALGLSLLIAAQFHVWWPLVGCIIAPYGYKMLRFAGIAKNYHQNTAEQLERNRAARENNGI